MKHTEKHTDGSRTYGERHEGQPALTDLNDSGKPFDRDRCSTDWLSFTGSGFGHQLSRSFWTGLAGIVIVGASAKFISGRLLNGMNQKSISAGYSSRFDLDAIEDVIATAKTTEGLLAKLSTADAYVRDEKSGRVFLSADLQDQMRLMLNELETSWPGFAGNQDIKLIKKLLSDDQNPAAGLTTKELMKAYDGLARRQEKRVAFLQGPDAIDGDISNLHTKAPKMPNVESMLPMKTEVIRDSVSSAGAASGRE